MLEQDLEQILLKYLTSTLGLKAWSVGPYDFKRQSWHKLPKDFPDIVGFNPGGRIFFIEVKTPRGKLTAGQKDFLEEMHELGALAGVACCEDDIDDILSGGIGNRDKFIKFEGYFKEE